MTMKKTILGISFLLLGGAYFAQCTDSTLLLDIPFDTTFKDESFMTNSFSASSGLYQLKDEDRFGDSTCYYWDGTGAVSLEYYGNDLQAPLPLTVSMWINLDTIGVQHALFANHNIPNAYSGIWIKVNANGEIEASAGFGTTGPAARYTETTNDTLQANNWYHMVCVYEPGAIIKVYLDGHLQSTTRSGTGNTMNYFASTAYAKIGRFVSSGTLRVCRGKIDDVKYLKRSMSSYEVMDLYMKEKTRDMDLIIDRPFDGSDIDVSGYNHLIDTNSGYLSADRFFIPKSAYYFNPLSSNDKISSNSLPSTMQVNFPFSCSFWVAVSDSTDNSFFYTNDDNQYRYTGFWVKSPTSGVVEVSIGNSGFTGPSSRKTATGDVKIKSNFAWNHIVCVVHDADSMDIYVDSVKSNVTYSGTASSINYIIGDNLGESIGGMYKGTTTLSTINGYMDDIKVWNRAISFEEVKYYFLKEAPLFIDTTIVQSGLNLYTNHGLPGATFQWVDCNNAYSPITGETSSSFTATTNGNYAVVITDTAHCFTDTSECVSINTVSIENPTNALFSIYPNPFNQTFTIQMANGGNGLFEIYNSIGAKLKEVQVIGRETVELNYSKGVYYLRDKSTNNMIKLIKQ